MGDATEPVAQTAAPAASPDVIARSWEGWLY